MKKAVVTGITGQDGSYLAELLLEKGYEVHGLTRKNFTEENKNHFSNMDRILGKVSLHSGDFIDEEGIRNLFLEIQPDEIYHLSGQRRSFVIEEDSETFEININATRFWLKAIKEIKKTCRFFFAGSSEMFGNTLVSPQNEETPFNPLSPYAISKVAGYHIVRMYRGKEAIFGGTGILYNHESPRRDVKYLPRKITSVAARIKLGLEKELKLGNLDAKRDWGFAGDYVEAMWLMLQANEPDDYVIGTGKIHSVKDILNIAFGELDLNWGNYVVVSKEFFREEGDIPMVADISKIKKELGWQPKTKFEELIKVMVRNDLKLVKSQ